MEPLSKGPRDNSQSAEKTLNSEEGLFDGESSRASAQLQSDIATMAGSLVHEIRNPLSTLHVNTQLLLEEWQDAQKPKERRTVKRLELMRNELKRLEETINSFRSFVQPYKLNLKQGSVNELIANLIEFRREAAGRKGIQIRSSLSEEVPSTCFDIELMRQVFSNLVKNAEEAMPGGGELIVKTEYKPPWIEVHVIDTGAGIPSDRLNSVFNLYYSTKPDGSGLGLARCLRIVKAHGGEIKVTSEERKGCQFTVRLPEEGGK